MPGRDIPRHGVWGRQGKCLGPGAELTRSGEMVGVLVPIVKDSHLLLGLFAEDLHCELVS
jgi:hypothetical protein